MPILRLSAPMSAGVGEAAELRLDSILERFTLEPHAFF